MKRNRIMELGLCVGMALVMASAPMFSVQEQGNKTLLEKIAGTWEYTAGYQSLQVEFYVEDGILKGREAGDDQAVDCEQDESNKMLFSGYTPDGEGFQVEFFKDEEGNITKSKLMMGFDEVEGTKIKTE